MTIIISNNNNSNSNNNGDNNNSNGLIADYQNARTVRRIVASRFSLLFLFFFFLSPPLSLLSSTSNFHASKKCVPLREERKRWKSNDVTTPLFLSSSSFSFLPFSFLFRELNATDDPSECPRWKAWMGRHFLQNRKIKKKNTERTVTIYHRSFRKIHSHRTSIF